MYKALWKMGRVCGDGFLVLEKERVLELWGQGRKLESVLLDDVSIGCMSDRVVRLNRRSVRDDGEEEIVFVVNEETETFLSVIMQTKRLKRDPGSRKEDAKSLFFGVETIVEMNNRLKRMENIPAELFGPFKLLKVIPALFYSC